MTVFTTEAAQRAAALREHGVFVVPIGDSTLRVGLCSVAEGDIPFLVEALVTACA